MGAPAFETHELGLSWLVDEDEKMARACHMVVVDGRVWVIDPVDFDGLDDRARELGAPAGVIQLLDRHARDCAAIAERLGVEHIEVPFEQVPGSPFEVIGVVDNRAWKENALWWPERQALIVAESVGSAAYFSSGEEPIGTHPMMRLLPPRRQLGAFRPEHLLTGHGTGMHGPGTAEALSDSLANARKRIPGAIVSLFRSG